LGRENGVGPTFGIRMAGAVPAILPVMALFIMLQREFISGLTAGAVKG